MPAGLPEEEPTDEQPSGYLHARYAESHREFGAPTELPGSKGWLIRRNVPGTGAEDAMGCYPLFACQDWSRLDVDLEALTDIVSVTVVTDPFGDYDETYLRRCFPDLVVPFKEHFVVDLEKPRNHVVTKNHRYYSRKALRDLTVHLHPRPPEFLDEWMRLHGHLVVKHEIEGVGTFSRDGFAAQLETPGIDVLWAEQGGEPVAAIVFALHGEVAYAHILGYTEVGYESMAQYALIWSALEHYSGKVRWVDLMGVPGLEDSGTSGIRQFKKGWTSETRMAWLCGVILDPVRYADLARAAGHGDRTYFPAYRAGERS